MTRVLRIDRISLDLAPPGAEPSPGQSRAVRTPEGYLDVDAYLARDGLLRYSDGRSTWMELRPRDELEAAASTWAHAIVTDDHPPVMVDAANAREYQRGLVISTPTIVEVDGVAYLAARLRITDAELVAKILAGQRELSIGFLADVHPEPGVDSTGQRYDAVQRSLAGNHVASVERGRAGPAVRVLLDSAQASAESCYSIGDAMHNMQPDPGVSEEHDPIAAAAVVERGLRMLSGHNVRVLLDSARASAESCYSVQVKPDHEVPTVSKPTLDSVKPRRKIKLPAGTKMDAVKAWCAHAIAKLDKAVADEVGMPTTMSTLIGPDGTEVEVPTWVAALVAEALDERKAMEGAEPQAPAAEVAPGDEDPLAPKPDDEEDKDKKMIEPMTPDAINALVRRRGRLERLSATAGIASATIDAADDTALARAYVTAVLPHCKARADKADGLALDELVEVAASTPVAVVHNPFEIVRKADAADDDDPILAAYAAHLSR